MQHAGTCKSVIFLFMYGGPSQVDTFDYKPKLYGLDGKTVDMHTKGRGGTKSQGRVVGPKWTVQQHGQCGKHVSTLFPQCCGVCGRHRVRPLDDGGLAPAWIGHAHDELREGF